jgi:hypothetical protein
VAAPPSSAFARCKAFSCGAPMKQLCLTCACLMLTVSAMQGHHSFAAVYFEQQQITIEGEIAEFDFRAPHAWVHVKVSRGEGEPEVYAAEWANPNRLTRDNISASTLKPGDNVRVSGSPARDPSVRRLHLKAIERPADGWRWGNRNGRPAESNRGRNR